MITPQEKVLEEFHYYIERGKGTYAENLKPIDDVIISFGIDCIDDTLTTVTTIYVTLRNLNRSHEDAVAYIREHYT